MFLAMVCFGVVWQGERTPPDNEETVACREWRCKDKPPELVLLARGNAS